MPEHHLEEESSRIIGKSFFILSLIIVGIVVFAREFGFPSDNSNNQPTSITLSQGTELTVHCNAEPVEIKKEQNALHVSCGTSQVKQTQTSLEIPDLSQSLKPTTIAPSSFFSVTATPVATQTGISVTSIPQAQ